MLPHYLVKHARKQAINNKIIGGVATYVRCGGDDNDQITKGLSLSLSVKIVKMGEYLAKLQARGWFSRAPSSFSNVVARRREL